MKADDIEKLIPAWIELQQTPRDSGRYDELFWSFEAIYNLVAGHPEQALEVILAILAADQSNPTYENLSAGPLEDLLVSHGPAMIDRIEAEAAANPHFRYLLGGVWQNRIDRPVWARVLRCRDRRGWDGIPK
jgi:hypothetical protein